MNRKRSLALVVIGLLVCVAAAAKEKAKAIANFRAFAVNMQGGPATNAGVVQIGIDRWSTDEERAALITTLKEKGSTALLNALVKLPPLGYIRMPNTLGWDLYYARQNQLPDGTRQVVIATNRPLGFGEVARQTRSADYDFTLVEMHFDKSGKGEGKLAAAAEITFNNKTQQIEIENYGPMPVKLLDIKETQPK
jgi:hypothetical protein